MTTSFKKILIALIVFFEFGLGAHFLYTYYQSTHPNQLPTVLNAQNIERPSDSELQNYYELKPNVEEIAHPEWLEKEAKYTYNSDGLNERYDYPLEKEKDVVRIVMLGDSYTFSQYMNTEENWTEQIEDQLNSPGLNLCQDKNIKYEVINLGVSGYDVSYIVERYKRKGQKYNPDLVLWLENNSGFFRSKELSFSIVEDCEKNNTFSKEQLVKGECHYQAEKTVIEKYGVENIARINNEYLADLFQMIDSKKVIFFGYKKERLNEKETLALNMRKEMYPFIQFRQIIPDIHSNKKENTLPDGHPNQNGYQIIKNAIFESLLPDLKNLCKN